MAEAENDNAAATAFAVGVSSSSASSVSVPKSKRMRAIHSLLIVLTRHRIEPKDACAGQARTCKGWGMLQLQSALGVVALIAFAWAISERRGAVSWRRVAVGLAITVTLAVVFLKIPPVQTA